MDQDRVLPVKYFEGMEERLAKLELALLRSKVIPPALQKMQQEHSADAKKGVGYDANKSLFRQYSEVMSGWGKIVSNRDEPLVSALVNKYSKAIDTCTLTEDKESQLLDSLNLSALDHKQKLSILLQNFSGLLNAANNLENSLLLDSSINPPAFRDYTKELDKLHKTIDSFDGFGTETRINDQKILVLLESYHLWCNAVSETFHYLMTGIQELEQRVHTLEKIRASEG
ncbi:hypothetical protein DSO57_1020791 [Entomophthora muscae]|uniref:Uncharacterized protein n=1 Tax=Entomophthora muscae TaxID=34485 RepID=A0ACC2SGF0_9FUNG|nr:hypothetical protein DSO57_1020791 [Entomophthora muscae]